MKAVVLFSGGYDSTVVLKMAVDLYSSSGVEALFFAYGQENRAAELRSASAIAAKFGVKFHVVPLGLDIISSGLTGGVPVPGAPFPEWMPMRNITMLSIAMARAVVVGASSVYLGGTKDDLSPDSSKSMEAVFAAVAEAALPPAVPRPGVRCLLGGVTKREVLKIGKKLGVPFDLATTCYRGTDCGKCKACKAFAEAS